MKLSISWCHGPELICGVGTHIYTISSLLLVIFVTNWTHHVHFFGKNRKQQYGGASWQPRLYFESDHPTVRLTNSLMGANDYLLLRKSKKSALQSLLLLLGGQLPSTLKPIYVSSCDIWYILINALNISFISIILDVCCKFLYAWRSELWILMNEKEFMW